MTEDREQKTEGKLNFCELRGLKKKSNRQERREKLGIKKPLGKKKYKMDDGRREMYNG